MDEQQRRNMQGDGIENTVEGKVKDIKGRFKDAAGGLTGDVGLQAEGKIDRLKGKIQEKVGEAQQDIAKEYADRRI